MRLHRRAFLVSSLAAPFVVGRAWAAPAAGNVRFLLIFMRGGYDAANTLIPLNNQFYIDSRPSIHIDAAATALDGDWGLHPALAPALMPLWRARQIAFTPFAGASDDLSRSHFETQDTIELGQPVATQRDEQSGFLSRLSEALSVSKAAAFTQQLPLVMRGADVIPNIPVANPAMTRPLPPQQAALIRGMYADAPLAAQVGASFAIQSEMQQTLQGYDAEMTAASRGAAAPRGFELAADRVGRLMARDFNLGFIDVGGWDTHVDQGGAEGQLAQKLGAFGRGLAALPIAMGPAWNDTIVVVVSEFGRTFRENGNRGTDHGHGSVYWTLGGAVKGGVIAGPQVRVTQANLNQDRDLPVFTDYRALLGGVFQRLYGLDAARLGRVFPNARPADLNLV